MEGDSTFARLFSTGGAGGHLQHVPSAARTMGLWLLLVSLGVFFFGALVAFLVIRTAGATSPPPGSIQLPWGLWYSTLFLLGASVSLHVAVWSVKREQQARFRRALVASAVLAVAFLVAQLISLPQLLAGHARVAGDLKSFGVYGFLWALIVVHAAHVVIGLVPLAVTTIRGLQGRYDHEAYLGVKHCVMYWHFLDVVWLAMFGVFLATA